MLWQGMDTVTHLASAARKTMQWRSVISGGLIVNGGEVPHGWTSEFVFDPGRAQVAIDKPYGVTIDGHVEYSTEGGGWTSRDIAAGQWMRADVRLPLTMCIDACLEATPAAPLHAAIAYDLDFDRDMAETLMDGGLNTRWTQITGRAVVAGMGYISDISIAFCNSADSSETRWVIRWFDMPVTIDIPDPASILSPNDPYWEAYERHR